MFQAQIVEKVKTHNLYQITFFSPEYCAAYEILWKNSEEHRSQGVCALHAGYVWMYEYVTLNAFPLLQQLLYERTSNLRYTYIFCLFFKDSIKFLPTNLTSGCIEQCFSTFVRPRPGKFFFYKTNLLVNTFPIFFKFIH